MEAHLLLIIFYLTRHKQNLHFIKLMFNKNRSDPPAWKAPDQRVFVSISEPTIVLVTVCTQGRKRWLAQADIHQALLKTWTQAAAWMIGRYVLMPDHLHFLCAPNE